MELISGVVALAGSMILFWYWFRYACLLILTAEPGLDHSEEVAEANQLSFREVRAKLRNPGIQDLDCLYERLARDFAVISYLLAHTPATGSDSSFENTALKIHYRLMSAWFRANRSFIGEAGTQALEEMSLVVAHFANAMGERRPALGQGASH